MIRVAPIPETFLDKVRAEGIDDLGQPVKRLVAAGGEPCRDVLRRATAGEELILASFSPFAKVGPYHEYGPVFVLANVTGESVTRDALPIHAEASSYFAERFVLRAYNENEEIVDAELVTRDGAPEVLSGFLERDDVAFVHARFPTYGCFACRIERPVIPSREDGEGSRST